MRAILVQARLDAGLTQAEVAARLGQKQNYVSNYERGERRLDVFELIEIADVLQIDPQFLTQKLVEIWRAQKMA